MFPIIEARLVHLTDSHFFTRISRKITFLKSLIKEFIFLKHGAKEKTSGSAGR